MFHLKGCRVGFTTWHQEVGTKKMVSEMDLEVEEDNLHIVAARLHQVLVQVFAPSADRIHAFAAGHAENIRVSAQEVVDLHQVIVRLVGTQTVYAPELMNGLIFQSATHAVSHAAGVQGDLDAIMDECLQEALRAVHQVVEAMGDHQEVMEIQYAGSVCRTHVYAP